ncbi:hypothetical protein pqer_cds_998 [Pandoravirus quercus]|uniref:F-box incomplete domain containing protein n=2 Tax=Pandoravirus TaxID=2060084 RepID=A0A2U7UAL0_9VIRU|nr:hypothetical protein pqer_cds_998 [Pandoravirus quercus]AVK75420.1 hypothetical protein pqer_cds_998 [Pandoravirus quercus]QBZ81600.1 hypothetical protein pclt_cds_1014 [Pandoravirus celtis]
MEAQCVGLPDNDIATPPPSPPGSCMSPGLDDMPPEIHAKIVACIDRPSHLLALRRASSLFVQADPVTAAIAWGAQRMHRLLPAGAPRDIVAAALAARGRPLCKSAIVHAVRGGRLDVVRIVFENIAATTACEQEDTDDGASPPNLPASTMQERNKVKVAGMMAAVFEGHLDIARYIYRESWHVRDNITSSALAKHAAASGRLDALIFAHDIYARKHAQGCGCGPDVGHAAWLAHKPDLVRWMRDTGCEGVCHFGVTHIAHAIRFGHLAMLRYMAADGWACIADINQDFVVSGAIADAAAEAGQWDTIVTTIDLGLCVSLTPILVGAASGDRVDIMARALDPRTTCTAGLPRPDRAAARAAVVAAATSDNVDALKWLLEWFGVDLADTPLMWMALLATAMDVVCFLETLLRDPFPWADALPFVLRSSLAPAARYLIEDKQVPVTPIAIAAAAGRDSHDRVLDFLCAVCTPDRLQAAVDMMGAVEDNCVSTVRGIKRRVPEVCTANIVAMQTHTALTSHRLDNDYKPIKPCGCVRCTTAPQPPQLQSTDRVVDADREIREPALKKNRTGPEPLLQR